MPTLQHHCVRGWLNFKKPDAPHPPRVPCLLKGGLLLY